MHIFIYKTTFHPNRAPDAMEFVDTANVLHYEIYRNTRLLRSAPPHHVLFLKHYLGKVDETWRPYLFMD